MAATPHADPAQRRAAARAAARAAVAGGLPLAAPNVLDRVVAWVSPKAAQRRLAARQGLALAGYGGGYSGASRSRAAVRNWTPAAQDADGDILPDLPTLRERSRDLVRNAPLAGGAISTMVANVVGTGLAAQPAIDYDALGITREAAEDWQQRAQAEWKLWAEGRHCDLTRRQNFYGLQALAFRSVLENGDALAILTSKAGPLPVTLAVQLVEADRVSNPDRSRDTATLTAGVEMDTDGAPIAYHVASRHPDHYGKAVALTWRRVSASVGATGRANAWLLMDQLRIGQTRGVPRLAPVIEPLKQLARYSEAELQAAVISGMFAVFVKMDPDAFETLFNEDGRDRYINSASNWDGTVDGGTVDGPGKAVNLLPGEEIISQNPGRPNSEFDPFFQAIVRQIGVGLELPFEVLIKHYTASYSAARAALLEAWRFYRGRRDWLATYFCQPVYEAWLEEAIATRRLAAPGFFADPRIRRAYAQVQWIGDGPGAIDPEKEVNAAEKRIALGISTRAAESVLHDGIDWRVKHRQLAEEEAARRQDGLAADPAAMAPAGSADDEDDPADDGSDDSSDDGSDDGRTPGDREDDSDREDRANRRPGTRRAVPARPGSRPAPRPARRQGAAALAAVVQIAELFGAQQRALLEQVSTTLRQAGVAREHTEDLARAHEEALLNLTTALINRTAEPVHIETKILVEQADTHFHQHAAPPSATVKHIERDGDGEMRTVAELPIPADDARRIAAAAITRIAAQDAAVPGPGARGSAQGGQ